MATTFMWSAAHLEGVSSRTRVELETLEGLHTNVNVNVVSRGTPAERTISTSQLVLNPATYFNDPSLVQKWVNLKITWAHNQTDRFQLQTYDPTDGTVTRTNIFTTGERNEFHNSSELFRLHLVIDTEKKVLHRRVDGYHYPPLSIADVDLSQGWELYWNSTWYLSSLVIGEASSGAENLRDIDLIPLEVANVELPESGSWSEPTDRTPESSLNRYVTGVSDTEPFVGTDHMGEAASLKLVPEIEDDRPIVDWSFRFLASREGGGMSTLHGKSSTGDKGSVPLKLGTLSREFVMGSGGSLSDQSELHESTFTFHTDQEGI